MLQARGGLQSWSTLSSTTIESPSTQTPTEMGNRARHYYPRCSLLLLACAYGDYVADMCNGNPGRICVFLATYLSILCFTWSFV